MNCHDFAALIARREEYPCGISRLTTLCGWLPRWSIVLLVVAGDWKEYWLTELQCVCITAKSEMPIANAITIQVVKLFDTYRNDNYRKGLLIRGGPPALVFPTAAFGPWTIGWTGATSELALSYRYTGR